MVFFRVAVLDKFTVCFEDRFAFLYSCAVEIKMDCTNIFKNEMTTLFSGLTSLNTCDSSNVHKTTEMFRCCLI